jgi:hypothetical protein
MNTNIETLVVILNDGETYTNIEGCGILSIPDDILDDDVDDYVKDHHQQGISIKRLISQEDTQ